MWIYGVLIRFRKLSEPEISDLCHFGPTSIWGVYRKMLMVSVGNLNFVNGGGNFLTLPSGKANQIPRMKGLFAFQASFLTLSLISTSIFLSYLQSPNPFLFLTALHFDWHMVQSTFKKKVWVGQWRQKGKARALCFLFKGISGLKGPYLLLCGCQRSCGRVSFLFPWCPLSSFLFFMPRPSKVVISFFSLFTSC